MGGQGSSYRSSRSVPDIHARQGCGTRIDIGILALIFDLHSSRMLLLSTVAINPFGCDAIGIGRCWDHRNHGSVASGETIAMTPDIRSKLAWHGICTMRALPGLGRRSKETFP